MTIKSPFDIVKNLNTEKNYDQIHDDGFYKTYNPWLINKAMANHQHTVLFANELNRRYGLLGIDQQYDFYYHGIPKAKRFGKWRKTTNDSDDLVFVMDHYGVNREKARSILARLTEEQIESLRSMHYTGGKA